MRIRFGLLIVVAACGRAPSGSRLAPESEPRLIPMPASWKWGSLTYSVPERLPGLLDDPANADYAALKSAGVSMSVVGGAAESYTLDVTTSGASINAADSAGLFYGLLTLRQAIQVSPAPTIHIEDSPRFRYRGMHLDVARHFMPVDFVKRYIDLMSRYKLNTFHWHLTDDQGWRIEIRKYPRLTEIGGCRKETVVDKQFTPYVGDGTPHCGFYTQDQIREVVAYADRRHVTVIPEIEMPGHAKAVLAAYPEFACTPGPFDVRTLWGVDDDVFCPKEETFRFIDGVLTEVAALFPGPYIHIGGDEVPKTRWKASLVAQEVMRRENLKNEEELQSWFIRRVEQMLIAKHKRLIGWDEILEGGLAPEATVMSWRGTEGGIAAAKQGHDVIMSPGSHLYFDAYQGDPRQEPLAIGGFLPLRKVYEFEPVPDSLTPDEAKHILGAQANLWTEYIPTPARAEYMAWPRALALAEVTWSPKSARSWESFERRLSWILPQLDRLGVNYRAPDVEGLESDRLTLSKSINVRLGDAMPSAEIRYTTNGAEPRLDSKVYDGPFDLPVTDSGVTVKARAFGSTGRVTAIASATFRHTTLSPSAAIDPTSLLPGITYTYHELQARLVRTIDTARVVRTAVVAEIARKGDERPERYGIRFTGFLRVPDDGIYEFALVSDDGSSLVIDDRLVVDNDGYHGADEKRGMIALAKGAHPIVVRYAQATGGAAFSLRVRRGDGAWSEIPAGWLFHAKP